MNYSCTLTQIHHKDPKLGPALKFESGLLFALDPLYELCFIIIITMLYTVMNWSFFTSWILT